MSDLPQSPSAERRLNALHEAYRRGILPTQQRSAYEEAVKRGLITAPAPAPDAGQPAGSARGIAGMAIERSRDLPGEMRLLQGYHPDVDYDVGTGWTDAVALRRSDNPEEKRAYLTSRYGEGNVFNDRGGRFVVRGPDGKLISPEGEGFLPSLTQGAAGLYADAPIIAGSAIGAGMGSVGGPPGAIAGATAGGALGKTAIEAVKGATGAMRKTIPELAESIGLAGLYEGGGEVLGRMVTGLPSAAGRVFREKFAGVTPETRDLTASVVRAGGTPPLRSATPGLASMAQTQDLSARLGSDFLEKRNREAVQTRLGEVVETPRIGQPEIEDALGQIRDPTSAVSRREAGLPTLMGARQEMAQLDAQVDNLARDADRLLTQQLGRLSAISRRAPPGELGNAVAAGIAEARRDFGRSMELIYGRAHQAAGGAEIVPTRAIQREARRILQTPPDRFGNPVFPEPAFVERLANLPERITLEAAQQHRAKLGELAELTNITPDTSKRMVNDLRASINTAFRLAEGDPAAAPAVRMLRRADELYSQGIRRFEDETVNRLVQQARTPGSTPDPNVIASQVLHPNHVPRAREIRQMVGPDVWRRVAGADMDSMLFNARDDQTGEVMARKLATLIRAKDRNGLLDLTYGPHLARDMRLYSQRLDARGGTIPAASLNPDNFGQTMRQLEVAQAQRDAYLSQNFLSDLAKPRATAEDAINFTLQPGSETRLMQAQQFFGADSPQMESIRQQAVKELLSSAVVRNETGTGTTIVGDGIEKALKRWTPAQQEILFPDGQANDMRRLAQEIRFMFPVKQEQMAGGMIAGDIKSDPFWLRIQPTAIIAGLSWIYSRPRVVKALAEGLKTPSNREMGEAMGRAFRGEPGGELPVGARRAATRETIRMIFRAEAAGELPHPDEAPEPGVMDRQDALGAVMNRRQTSPPIPVPPLRGGSPAPPPAPAPDGPMRRIRSTVGDDDFIEPPPRELREPTAR